MGTSEGLTAHQHKKDEAMRRWTNYNDAFSRFATISDCDRRTDRETTYNSKYA